MPEDSIAIVPNLGYDPSRQFSMKGCRWLAWMSRDGRVIRHAKNGGKMQIGPYTVEGYDEETQTVYEFYGCYWHGCTTCPPELETQIHPHRSDCTYGSCLQEARIIPFYPIALEENYYFLMSNLCRRTYTGSPLPMSTHRF